MVGRLALVGYVERVDVLRSGWGRVVVRSERDREATSRRGMSKGLGREGLGTCWVAKGRHVGRTGRRGEGVERRRAAMGGRSSRVEGCRLGQRCQERWAETPWIGTGGGGWSEGEAGDADGLGEVCHSGRGVGWGRDVKRIGGLSAGQVRCVKGGVVLSKEWRRAGWSRLVTGNGLCGARVGQSLVRVRTDHGASSGVVREE